MKHHDEIEKVGAKFDGKVLKLSMFDRFCNNFWGRTELEKSYDLISLSAQRESSDGDVSILHGDDGWMFSIELCFGSIESLLKLLG